MVWAVQRPLGVLLHLELETLTHRQRLFASRNAQRESPIRLVLIESYSRNAQLLRRYFDHRLQDRSVHAHFIRFMRRGAPKKVIFDIAFDGGTPYDRREGDLLMAQSLEGSSGFGSALMFYEREMDGAGWEDLSPEIRQLLLQNAVQVDGLTHFPPPPPAFYPRYPSLHPPFQALLDTPMRFYSAKGGAMADALDTTETVRRWIPFSVYGDHAYPTLTLGALLDKPRTAFRLSPEGLLQWEGAQVRLGKEGAPLIKWYGNQNNPKFKPYTEVYYWDVVMSELVLQCREGKRHPICGEDFLPAEPPLKPEQFDGQYVLINLIMENTYDKHKTIYGPNYPGVFILANTLDNLLHDDFVHKAPPWLDALVLMGLGALVVLTAYGTYQAYAELNLWVNLVNPSLALVALFAGSYAWRYLKTEKHRQQMRYAFGKYVSPAVLANIEQNPDALKLGGQRRELTLFFCDIRGFTAFSESQPPEALEQMLIDYFSVMNDIIKNQYRGTINKLMGDAIMAYWGFPVGGRDDAFLAVSAALAMKEALIAWNGDPARPPLNIGIGINTGEVVIGNIGSQDFMDFTVIGDAVNLASRLEGMNKDFGTNIIISASTYAQIKDRIEARSLGMVQVRGKSEAVEIFEPLGFRDSRSEAVAV